MNWFKIQNSIAGETEIRIYGEIGSFGITAEDFANVLNQISSSTIRLRINSPGGVAFDAFAIYNLLRSKAVPIVACVDGLAASAASIVMLAGDTIEIAENAFVMIHSVSGGAYGTAGDLSDYAAVMTKMDATLAKMYGSKMAISEAEALALMKAETWYTGAEAVEAGLADTVVNTSETLPVETATAIFKFGGAPERLRSIAAMAAKKPTAKPVAATVPPAPTAAKAQAAHEWDTNPHVHRGWSTRERYIMFREQEIVGKIKVSGVTSLHRQTELETSAPIPRPVVANAAELKAWASQCAEYEFVHDPARVQGFSSKQSFVNCRVAELTGTLRVFGSPPVSAPVPVARGGPGFTPTPSAQKGYAIQIRQLGEMNHVDSATIEKAIKDGISIQQAHARFLNRLPEIAGGTLQ